MFKSISSVCVLSFTLITSPAMANDSQLASRTSRDSVVASGTLVALGVKVVAGVVLRPVARAARDSQAVGRALNDSRQAMDDTSRNQQGAPQDGQAFDISPETIVAQPVPKVPFDHHPADAAATTPGAAIQDNE